MINFWAEVIKTLISAVIGAGILGTIFGLINKKINKKLLIAEEEQKKKKENRIMRIKLDDALFSNNGASPVLAVQVRCNRGKHNGDLDKAFDAFEQAEQKRKDFKNGIYAESEQDC